MLLGWFETEVEADDSEQDEEDDEELDASLLLDSGELFSEISSSSELVLVSFDVQRAVRMNGSEAIRVIGEVVEAAEALEVPEVDEARAMDGASLRSFFGVGDREELVWGRDFLLLPSMFASTGLGLLV